jgi:long-chain fatty acid transport protein
MVYNFLRCEPGIVPAVLATAGPTNSWNLEEWTMKAIRHLCTGAVVVFLLFPAVPAQAGGLYLYEVGSPDVGAAAAGYAARAQDASTVYTNPAGMTRLSRPELMLGVQPMYLNMKFSPNSSTTTSGPDGDASTWIPGGSLFYAHPVTKDLHAGFAVVGNFGLSVEYEDNWVGRYYAQEATLQGITFMPAVSYRVAPGLSIGAGLGMMYGTLKTTIAIPNRQLFDPLPDGQLTLEDHDWGFNGKFGILYELDKATRFGVTYTTDTKLDFSTTTEFSGLGPILQDFLRNRGLLDAPLDLGVTAPQAVMVSAFHDFTEKLALMANIGWEQWSKFGKVEVGIYSNDPQSLTTQLQYKDTWHGALGAQYRVSDPWLLTTGVAYDSSMINDDQRSPALPVGDTWRFGLGGLYTYSEKVTLGTAYELAWGGDMPMTVSRGPAAGTVSGEYKNTAIHVLSLNMNYKF